MASNQTSNYGLNQWEATDQVLRTEFNDDNQKIDGALAGKGNCQIVYGGYQATNTSGNNGACTLTFPGKPLLLMILDDVRGGHMVMTSGAKYAFLSYFDYDVTYRVKVEWPTLNSVKWWSNNAFNQANDGGKYHYVALIAAGEVAEDA